MCNIGLLSLNYWNFLKVFNAQCLYVTVSDFSVDFLLVFKYYFLLFRPCDFVGCM